MRGLTFKERTMLQEVNSISDEGPRQVEDHERPTMQALFAQGRLEIAHTDADGPVYGISRAGIEALRVDAIIRMMAL